MPASGFSPQACRPPSHIHQSKKSTAPFAAPAIIQLWPRIVHVQEKATGATQLTGASERPVLRAVGINCRGRAAAPNTCRRWSDGAAIFIRVHADEERRNLRYANWRDLPAPTSRPIPEIDKDCFNQSEIQNCFDRLKQSLVSFSASAPIVKRRRCLQFNAERLRRSKLAI